MNISPPAKRHDAQRALLSAFWQLIEPLPEPAFLIHRSGRVRLANGRARHRFGLDTPYDPEVTGLRQSTGPSTGLSSVTPDDDTAHSEPRGPLFAHLFCSRDGGDPEDFLRLCRRSRQAVPGVLHARQPTESAEHAVAGFRVDDEHCLVVLSQTSTASSRFDRLNDELTRAQALARTLHDERARAQRAAHRLRTTLEVLAEGVISTDAAFRVEFANGAALELLGLNDLPYGESAARVLVVRDPSGDARVVVDDPATALPDGPLHLTTAGGRTRYIRVFRRAVSDPFSSRRLDDDHGRAPDGPRGWLFVLRDVTEEYANTRLLAFEASHDHLTGLFNRRQFEALLQALLRRIDLERAESGRPATRRDAARPAARAVARVNVLLFLDLDQFKLVNDSLGHHAGDALLRAIGDALSQHLREPDVVARFGGDEFAIVVQDMPSTDLDALAARIASVVENAVVDWDSTRISLSASIGGLILDAHAQSVHDALRKVDIACHRAKRQGRGRVVWYGPDLEAGADAPRPHFGMINRLRAALARGRMPLHLQRIETLVPGLPDHHEVLVRLDDDEGFVPPGEFLAVAEAHGWMPELDLYVVHNAVRLLEQARDGAIPDLDRPDDRLCVNLSGQTLNDERALAAIEAMVADHRDAARRIVFEITETSALRSPGDLRSLIERLNAYGVEFALDDFGTGYSSFQYLRQVPAHILKIDGQFIRQLHRDPIDRTLVRALTDIAHSLGKRVIAESVEHPEVRDLLRMYGVEYAQGYDIDRPHPIAGFTAQPRPAPTSAPDAGATDNRGPLASHRRDDASAL